MARSSSRRISSSSSSSSIGSLIEIVSLLINSNAGQCNHQCTFHIKFLDVVSFSSD